MRSPCWPMGPVTMAVQSIRITAMVAPCFHGWKTLHATYNICTYTAQDPPQMIHVYWQCGYTQWFSVLRFLRLMCTWLSHCSFFNNQNLTHVNCTDFLCVDKVETSHLRVCDPAVGCGRGCYLLEVVTIHCWISIWLISTGGFVRVFITHLHVFSSIGKMMCSPP